MRWWGSEECEFDSRSYDAHGRKFAAIELIALGLIALCNVSRMHGDVCGKQAAAHDL